MLTFSTDKTSMMTSNLQQLQKDTCCAKLPSNDAQTQHLRMVHLNKLLKVSNGSKGICKTNHGNLNSPSRFSLIPKLTSIDTKLYEKSIETKECENSYY